MNHHYTTHLKAKAPLQLLYGTSETSFCSYISSKVSQNKTVWKADNGNNKRKQKTSRKRLVKAVEKQRAREKVKRNAGIFHRASGMQRNQEASWREAPSSNHNTELQLTSAFLFCAFTEFKLWKCFQRAINMLWEGNHHLKVEFLSKTMD